MSEGDDWRVTMVHALRAPAHRTNAIPVVALVREDPYNSGRGGDLRTASHTHGHGPYCDEQGGGLRTAPRNRGVGASRTDGHGPCDGEQGGSLRAAPVTAAQVLRDADNNGTRADTTPAMYVPSGPGAYSTSATLAWGARRLRGRIYIRFAPGTQYAPLSIRVSGHTHKKHSPPPGGAGPGALHAGTHYRSPADLGALNEAKCSRNKRWTRTAELQATDVAVSKRIVTLVTSGNASEGAGNGRLTGLASVHREFNAVNVPAIPNLRFHPYKIYHRSVSAKPSTIFIEYCQSETEKKDFFRQLIISVRDRFCSISSTIGEFKGIIPIFCKVWGMYNTQLNGKKMAWKVWKWHATVCKSRRSGDKWKGRVVTQGTARAGQAAQDRRNSGGKQGNGGGRRARAQRMGSNKTSCSPEIYLAQGVGGRNKRREPGQRAEGAGQRTETRKC
ncbi:hypothetical protein B0H14DRAFT_3129054 [Mycena olivaceomarginata]|nr:hypothetical protein B0H14DRAFT_3129054 [Mycena olivaceomarginata]